MSTRRIPQKVQKVLTVTLSWKGLHSSTSQFNQNHLCDYNHPTYATKSAHVELSVGRRCPVYLLEIEGLLTEGSRPGRTIGESVGGILEMDSSDWLNGIRYQTFDTRPDTEFKVESGRV